MRRRWRSRSRSSVEEEEANHDGAPGLVGVANDGRWLRERRRHVGDGARVRRVSETEGGSMWILEAQRRVRGGQVGEMGGGAKATGRPYPLPASAPARWSGGDGPLLLPRSGEQGGGDPGRGCGLVVGQLGQVACELGRLVQ